MALAFILIAADKKNDEKTYEFKFAKKYIDRTQKNYII